MLCGVWRAGEGSGRRCSSSTAGAGRVRPLPRIGWSRSNAWRRSAGAARHGAGLTLPRCRPPASQAPPAPERSAPDPSVDRGLLQQVVEVDLAHERARHVGLAVRVPRPLVERAVPAQLQVVAVGVGDVDRLVGAVVGGLADGQSALCRRRRRRPAPRASGSGWRRGAGRRRRRAAARRRGLPGVEAEVVVVAAGRHEQDVAGGAPAGHVARLITTSKPIRST